MLQLKLYPAEFLHLILYLRQTLLDQARLPLQEQHVGKLTLVNYLMKWPSNKLTDWTLKKSTQKYTVRLPAVVALALYQDMWTASLNAHQQMVFDKLDEAIVNYRNPYAQPHSIRELLTGY